MGRIGRTALVAVMVAVMVSSAAAPAAGQEPGDATNRYGDVEPGSTHEANISELADEGVFDGTECEDGFCPSAPIKRWEMAVWLVRIIDGGDVSGPSRFADVPSDVWWAGYVERLAELGITSGCGSEPPKFCPTQPVTRAQMATFLVQAFDLPEAPRADFEDVVEGSTHAANIDALAASGVTAGCGGRRYCPGRNTSRAHMATFLNKARSLLPVMPTIDLAGITPALAVRVDNPVPTVGDSLDIVATVTDEDGMPLSGAALHFIIDGESRATVLSGPDGQATFTYSAPIGPSNEGGYDSIQVQVVTTDAVSRPVGVFWQPDESRRIIISVNPDRPHAGPARTITAQVFNGASAMAGQTVEFHIDGTVAGRATTNSEGIATFTHRAQVHGPFDLARVVLAQDRSVASNEILISWPMSARGSHHSNNWELVWSDEFGGNSVDASKWRAINNCPPVYLACDTDRPENVYVADGMLQLRSLRERYVGTNKWTGSGSQFGPLTTFTPGEFLQRDFTAGRVDSAMDFTYGRFELLGKLPQGHGTFFAFWMRPRNSPYGNDAAGGEIDIAEGANIGRGGNRRGRIDAQLPGDGWGVHHVVHMGYPFANPFELTNLPVNPAESFHLYAVEWDTASIRFYVDDQRVLTVPQSDWFSHPRNSDDPVDNPYAPFDQPFFIVINNTVGNWALETWPGNQVPDTTVFPAEFVVDYVRVYECRPPAGTSVPGPGQGCEIP